MPPDKDDKDDTPITDKANKLLPNEANTDKPCIKFKTNKVSDINRQPHFIEIHEPAVHIENECKNAKETEKQKKRKKIHFNNNVKVKDSPNHSYTLDRICEADAETEAEAEIEKEASELGFTIEDVDDKNDPEDSCDGTPPMKKAKSVQLPRERVIDMSPEDQKQWELEEMLKPIDLEKAQIHIDPSPFQLVERTSILKVHSLFSMVGINHAYVTKIGRLVGVVGLKELRKAIEDINSNSFVAHPRDDEIDGDTKSAVEKPLLSPSASDKAVDMTITSMDSALSNSDNCSDIEMEHMKSLDTPEVTLTMPPTDTNTTTTTTTIIDTNDTQNINKSV